jgi:uncharacterized membrane protein
MNDVLFQSTRIGATIGCGVMCGVFFAFSTAVMPGLSRLEPTQAIAAMQAMNRAILNPAFLTLFLTTPLLCVTSAILASRNGFSLAMLLTVVGCSCFLGGALFVTFRFNVPMNDQLATLTPNAAESARDWREYLEQWTTWNHVRVIASLAATTLLGIAQLF